MSLETHKKIDVERIQNSRKINKQQEFDTQERLKKLKSKRDLLQREKNKLSDSKTMDSEEKSVYYFGLGVVTIVGGILFYSVNPILVGLISMLYAIGLPTVRTGIIIKKEFRLINELVDLDKEIEELNIKLIKKENNNEKKVLIIEDNSEQVNLSINNECDRHNIDDLMLMSSNYEKENLVVGPRLIKGYKKNKL